jgi:hypothetical protein
MIVGTEVWNILSGIEHEPSRYLPALLIRRWMCFSVRSSVCAHSRTESRDDRSKCTVNTSPAPSVPEICLLMSSAASWAPFKSRHAKITRPPACTEPLADKASFVYIGPRLAHLPGLNSTHCLAQACSTLYVVRVTSAKFGMRLGNMKFNTQNEE